MSVSVRDCRRMYQCVSPFCDACDDEPFSRQSFEHAQNKNQCLQLFIFLVSLSIYSSCLGRDVSRDRK